jgi:hypothetical protein
MPGSRVRVPPLLFSKARESNDLGALSFSLGARVTGLELVRAAAA